MRLFHRFLHDARGATAVEYGVLAAIIGITLAAALGNYYNLMDNMFGDLANIYEENTQ